MRRIRVGIAMTLALAGIGLLLAGCGGGLGGLIDIYRDGELDYSDESFPDGSLFDCVNIKASEDGTIYALMGSDYDFGDVDDPYLYVLDGKGDTWDEIRYLTIIDEDDDSGPNSDAFLDYYGFEDDNYTIVLTTAGPGDTGDYYYRISEEDAVLGPTMRQESSLPEGAKGMPFGEYLAKYRTVKAK